MIEHLDSQKKESAKEGDSWISVQEFPVSISE